MLSLAICYPPQPYLHNTPWIQARLFFLDCLTLTTNTTLSFKSKHHKLLPKQNDITCQMTQIFSSTIRTSIMCSIFAYLKIQRIALHQSVFESPALGFATRLIFSCWPSFHVTRVCWSWWSRGNCARSNLTTALFIFVLVASVTKPDIKSSNPC